jgi:hypothetical protein
MPRIIFVILAIYVAALALVDTLSYNGRYRRAVWQEANYQALRVHAEVRFLLVKIGI